MAPKEIDKQFVIVLYGELFVTFDMYILVKELKCRVFDRSNEKYEELGREANSCTGNWYEINVYCSALEANLIMHS